MASPVKLGASFTPVTSSVSVPVIAVVIDPPLMLTVIVRSTSPLVAGLKRTAASAAFTFASVSVIDHTPVSGLKVAVPETVSSPALAFDKVSETVKLPVTSLTTMAVGVTCASPSVQLSVCERFVAEPEPAAPTVKLVGGFSCAVSLRDQFALSLIAANSTVAEPEVGPL